MRMYVVLVVLLNVLTGFLLLLGTNRLTGCGSGAGRLLGAAVMGGAFAWGCLQPGFTFLGSTLWRVVSLVLMGMLAFGWDSRGWKRSGIFLMLSLALEDALITGRCHGLLPAAVAIWALSRLCFDDGSGQNRECVPLEIRYGEETVKLTALCDTGNSLADPMTGEPVLVIGAGAAEKLTGLTEEQLKKPLDTLMKRPLPGLRLIPYRALGQPAGLLLAMRFRGVKLGKKQRDALIAMAPDRIGRGEDFQALAGGMV